MDIEIKARCAKCRKRLYKQVFPAIRDDDAMRIRLDLDFEGVNHKCKKNETLTKSNKKE